MSAILRKRIDALRQQPKANETDQIHWGYNSAIDDVLLIIKELEKKERAAKKEAVDAYEAELKAKSK